MEDLNPLKDLDATVLTTERFNALVSHVQKLSSDLHTVKGNLATNTLFTRTVADQNEAIRGSITELRTQGAEVKTSVGELSIQGSEMKASVGELRGDTSELLEIFRALRGGFKVLGWLGMIAKWVGGIAAAVTALYALWHHK